MIYNIPWSQSLANNFDLIAPLSVYILQIVYNIYIIQATFEYSKFAQSVQWRKVEYLFYLGHHWNTSSDESYNIYLIGVEVSRINYV